MEFNELSVADLSTVSLYLPAELKTDQGTHNNRGAYVTLNEK